MASTKREKISSDLAAKVLFLSDRTCCVCNEKKPVQIHHIDENTSNNNFANLAVLCFDCHTETQIKGGFHRKLDGDQVSLYRDHWIIQVAKSRATDPRHYVDEYESVINKLSIEVATSVAEIYRENEEYRLLALHYSIYENNELRDKYIELAIEKGMDDEELIFYRHAQGKIHLVPEEIISKKINELTENHDYSSLARLYRVINDPINSIKSTCKFVLKSLEKGTIFGTAFYLNEMFKEGDVRNLFLMSLEKAKSENDLWWQYRALQELDWSSEINRFLLENKEQIIAENKLPLLKALALAEGDIIKYFTLQKEIAKKDCE